MLNKIVFARMKEEDVLFLKKVCKARNETVSSFVRRAVRLLLGTSEFRERRTNFNEVDLSKEE